VLGLIEGFYGPPWPWQARRDAISFLGPKGYTFYLYAPKADALLRRRWQEEHSDGEAEQLEALAAHCRQHGVRFGVGLSPYDAFRQFDAGARAALDRKLAFLDGIGIDDLAVLFDDMRGDLPQLAEKQAEIVHHAAARTKATRIIVCPTYYSDDAILDRLFGNRPSDYLTRFGQLIDPGIEMFWTGAEICSREYSAGNLDRVAAALRRKPFLWDNYPVNDSPRMSLYLYIRGFTGRPASMRDHVAAHGINVALQPTLSRIPALTLLDSYALGPKYDYSAATRRAAIEVLGDALGEQLYRDMLVLQDIGLDRLGDKADDLRSRYSAVDHPGAREVIGWLDGDYRVTEAMIHAS
jgi:hyaluronoglucosaminidase